MGLFDKKTDSLDDICASKTGNFGPSIAKESAIFPEYFGRSSSFTGTKTPNGYGIELSKNLNYHQIRERCESLFVRNPYFRGIIRRIVTNTITDGLTLEATPDEDMLGLSYEESTKWQKIVESRWRVYWKSPDLCDYRRMSTGGQIEEAVDIEALVGGDCLIVHMDETPRILAIPGGEVRTPIGDSRAAGKRIIEGVEIDEKTGEHLAFWVRSVNKNINGGIEGGFTYTRIEARGKTGRRVAYLVYGSDKRYNSVRGEPILGIHLQSIREIDRYRDSVQKYASRSSEIIGFTERQNPESLRSNGFGAGGGPIVERTIADPDNGTGEAYHSTEVQPGIWVNSLAVGEKLIAYQTQGHLNFGEFERTIVANMAWTLEVSPGILQMSFSSNYAASAGEKEEFKMFLNKRRIRRADQFNSIVYKDWLIDQHLTKQIKNDKFLKAYRTDMYAFGAWCMADWAGAIKASVDVLKQTNAYIAQIKEGLITRARAARELNGMKFSDNAKQLRRENEELGYQDSELPFDMENAVEEEEKELNDD